MPTLYWSPLPKPRALPGNLCGLLLPVHTLLLSSPGLGGWGLASSIGTCGPMGLLLCVPGKHLPEGPGHLVQWLWGFWSLRGGGGAQDQQRAGGALHEVRAGGPRLRPQAPRHPGTGDPPAAVHRQGWNLSQSQGMPLCPPNSSSSLLRESVSPSIVSDAL